MAPDLDGPAHHRGVDGAGRDGVDRDAVRSKIERERLGQRDDPALGGDVVGHPPRARLRGRRRDGHDASPPPPPPCRAPRPAGSGRSRTRLTAIMRSQASAVMSRKSSNPSIPALVTMISTGPRSRRTSSSAASTAERSLTSTATPTRGEAVGLELLGRLRRGRVADNVEDGDLASLLSEVPADGPAHARAAPGDHATRLTSDHLSPCRPALVAPPRRSGAPRPRPVRRLVATIAPARAAPSHQPARDRAGRVGRCYGRSTFLSSVPSA